MTQPRDIASTTNAHCSLVRLAEIVTDVCADLATEGRTESEATLTAYVTDEHPEAAHWGRLTIEVMASAAASRAGVLA